MEEKFRITAEAERRFPLPFDRRAFQEMASSLGDHDLPIYAHWTGQTIVGKVHLSDTVETDWAEGNCFGYINGYFKINIHQPHIELYDSPLRSFKLNIKCDPIVNHKIRIGATLEVMRSTGVYQPSGSEILYEG